MSTIVITGCSSGIGLATAKAFLLNGDHVVATCRSVDSPALNDLRQAYPGNLQCMEMDVTNSVSIRKVVVAISAGHEAIDVLVNNAGMAIPGPIEALAEQDCRQAMDTNFWGALRMSRAVLPYMRARRSGVIVMLSSLSALIGLPCDGMYAASKAALEIAAESLRAEVQPFGIKVCVVQPGNFKSRLAEKAVERAHDASDSVYGPLLKRHIDSIRSGVPNADDPQLIAATIVAIAHTKNPGFRYPVGSQAQSVIAKLRTMSEQERVEFIETISDTAWWAEGKGGSD